MVAHAGPPGITDSERAAENALNFMRGELNGTPVCAAHHSANSVSARCVASAALSQSVVR